MVGHVLPLMDAFYTLSPMSAEYVSCRMAHCLTGNLTPASLLRMSVIKYLETKAQSSLAVFLNRRAAARYRALESIIPGRERFSWNLSF